MLIKNAIKKLQKLGLEVQNNKQQYFCIRGSRSIKVIRNGHSDEVAVIATSNMIDTDYPNTSYHHSLSSPIGYGLLSPFQPTE